MLSILSVAVFSVLVVGLAILTYMRFRGHLIKQVQVHIEQNAGKGFLTQKEVFSLFDAGDSIQHTMIKQLNLKKIKVEILKSPYVKTADAYLNVSGNLVVNIKEKKALMRVVNRKKKSCYIDKEGGLFPLGKNYSERALFVNGYINTPLYIGKRVTDSVYSKTILPGLYDLAVKINADPFLNSIISQIFVNSKGKIDLIPELGSYIIHFGNLGQMEVKLENLKAFFKQALIKEGWNKYKSINLAFTNQVICTKK